MDSTPEDHCGDDPPRAGDDRPWRDAPEPDGLDTARAEHHAAMDAFRRAPEGALAHLFERAECEQHEVNRRAALRAESVADAIAYARSRSFIYTDLPGADGARAAEDAAVLEASTRLRVSEDAVRGLVATADTARSALPTLWADARDGFVPLLLIEKAIALLPRFSGDAARIAQFDAQLAEFAPTATPASFQRKASRLARRLNPQSDAIAHADAFGRRTVTVADAGDGMSIVTAFVSTVDAVALKRRLTATAKNVTKTAKDGRSRDQIRADLFVSWLRGTGTPTAVKTKVFVTVPLDALAEGARASVRTMAGAPGDLPAPGIDLAAEPLVLGGGPLDRDSARRLLLESGRFTRVITDPVTGAIVDMDRRSRLVTRAQHEWLMLAHHLCTRDGCNRAAIDAEIDHWNEFHGPERGPTNLANLHPLCGSDHRHKGRTKIRYSRRRSGSVQLTFPTGHQTTSEWSRRLHDLAQRLKRTEPYPDEPPF